MAINFQKETFEGHTPEIWRGECKILPGGFKLDSNSTIATGSIVRRGTPVEVNFSTMSAKVAKSGVVVTGGTTTKPRMAKGHLFAVGDVVTKANGDGSASKTISAIDSSNTDYDVITLNSAYTGLVADDVLVESTAYGYYDAESTDEGALKVVASSATDGQINLASVTPYNGTKTLAANDYVILKNAEAAVKPNMVVGSDKEFNGKGLPTLDVAYEAVVLYPSLLTPVLSGWLNDGGCCLKNNPNILFIKQ